MKAYLSIFITILFFSTIEVSTKLLDPSIDPILLAFIRFMTAGTILFFVDIKRVFSFSRSDLLLSAGLALLGVTIGFASYHIALKHINASTAAVIFSINPIFTGIAAGIILKEKPGKQVIYGMLLGFIGVYLVSFGLKIPVIDSAKGPLLMLFSALTFGVYISAAKLLVRKHGPLIVNGIIFLIGAIFLIPLVHSWWVPSQPGQLLVLGYLALFATAVAYVLYFYGLSRVPVAAGNTLFYIKPVVATLLSVMILHEKLKLHFFAGLIVILLSLGLTGITRFISWEIVVKAKKRIRQWQDKSEGIGRVEIKKQG